MRCSVVTTCIALGVAVFVAGCGGSSGSESSSKQSAAPAKPQQITAPKANKSLTDELGATAAKLRSAGCSFGTFAQDDVEHVDQGEDLKSSTFPPTSGHHYADWAPFGVYEEPIEDGFAVHNLEHGGVVVWLGSDVDDNAVKAVSKLPKDGEKWVVAPRSDIPGVYSAAWATGLSCPPEAVTKLGADELATALRAWYDVVESTGSPAEKDVPAYAGAMKEPTPTRDISEESPF